MENKRLIAAAKYAVWLRNYQRARVRALTRLAKAYPDEYKELFEEEKLNDHTQGKAWLDVHGNTGSTVSYEQKLQNKKLAIRYAHLAFGWKGRERKCLVALWTRESRFDNHARPLDGAGRPRSSAFGIAQHLGETSRDPATQILRGLRYISYRYDTPCRADAFQRRNNYY